MNNNLVYVLSGVLLLVLILVEAISESLIRYSITSKSLGFIKSKSVQLSLGILGYVAVAFLFYLFLKYFKGSFAFANAIWQIGNIILITLISMFLFNTKLNFVQWIGFSLLIIGLILFSIENKEQA
tara:strand:+ start:5898 stop:6275 length:378 start_codon:yes stop_codon:yes gene_type:complete